VEEPVQKILVGVAGGSAAGKTTLCENIYRQMAFDRNFKVEIISLDSFYKSISFLIQMLIKPRLISDSIISTTPTLWIST
jgi:uridine kinase